MKKHRIAFAAIVVGMLGVLTGCSSEDLGPSNQAITQVIDVRHPDEYAAGHVAGAINIDVESGDPNAFASAIAALDPNGTYLVYCHSGRRSGIAAEQMKAAGLNVLDGGAIQSMLDRGWTLGS